MNQFNEYLTDTERELVGRSDEYVRARVVAGAAELACLLGLNPANAEGVVVAFRLEAAQLDPAKADAVQRHLGAITAVLCQTAHEWPAAGPTAEVIEAEASVEVPPVATPIEPQPVVLAEVLPDSNETRGLSHTAQTVLKDIFGDTTALFGSDICTTGVTEDDATTIVRTIMELRGPIKKGATTPHEARFQALFDGLTVKEIVARTGESCGSAAIYTGFYNTVNAITKRADFTQVAAYAQLEQALGTLESVDTERPVEVVMSETLPNAPVVAVAEQEVVEVPPSDEKASATVELVEPEQTPCAARLIKNVRALLSPEAQQQVNEDMLTSELTELITAASETIYATDGQKLLACYLEYLAHEQPLKELSQKHHVSFNDTAKLINRMPQLIAKVVSDRYVPPAPEMAGSAMPTPLAMPGQRTLTYTPPPRHYYAERSEPAADEPVAVEATEPTPAVEERVPSEPTPLVRAALSPETIPREDWIQAARQLVNHLTDHGLTKDEAMALWQRMHFGKTHSEMTGNTVTALRKVNDKLQQTTGELPSELIEQATKYFALGSKNDLTAIHRKLIKHGGTSIEEAHIERYIAAGLETVFAAQV